MGMTEYMQKKQVAMQDRLTAQYNDSIQTMREHPNKRKLLKFILKMLDEYEITDDNLKTLDKKSLEKLDEQQLLEIFNEIIEDADMSLRGQNEERRGNQAKS